MLVSLHSWELRMMAIHRQLDWYGSAKGHVRTCIDHMVAVGDDDKDEMLGVSVIMEDKKAVLAWRLGDEVAHNFEIYAEVEGGKMKGGLQDTVLRVENGDEDGVSNIKRMAVLHLVGMNEEAVAEGH